MVIMTAQEAGQVACKARMSFEYHVNTVLGHAIEAAANRGEQSCSVTFRSLGMPELCAKRAESLLNSRGYKASYKVNLDGSITMGVSWVPSMKDIAPELFKLSEGK